MIDTDPFTIERAGTDETSFRDVGALLVQEHRECGYAQLEADAAGAAVYSVLDEGMTYLARLEGRPIGVIALTLAPLWFAPSARVIINRGFYVEPALRKGRVGSRLLQAAKREGIARNMIVLITITNPDRRPKRNHAALEAQIAGFVPLGYRLRLT